MKAESEEFQRQAEAKSISLKSREAELSATVDRLKTEAQALHQQLTGSQVCLYTAGIRC